MAHTFLSEEWLAAVKRLVDEDTAAGKPPAFPPGVELNVVVTDGPGGTRSLHVRDGVWDEGLLADAPTTSRVPYSVARAVFVDGNVQVGMQAFMAGQVKVEGDITKLMALQAQPADAERAAEVQRRVQAITAPD